MATNHGGRRTGAGHPTAHDQVVKQQGLAAAAAAEARVLHANYEEMLEAALYVALGKKAVGCLRCQKLIVDCKCLKPDKGMVYEVKPDSQMLRALIEKVGGKAVAQQQAVTDTKINLVHSVPRPETAVDSGQWVVDSEVGDE